MPVCSNKQLVTIHRHFATYAVIPVRRPSSKNKKAENPSRPKTRGSRFNLFLTFLNLMDFIQSQPERYQFLVLSVATAILNN